MLDFLAPLWFWSFLAVGLPLALHLLSRGQRRSIRIGSVKLLQEARSHSFRRISLHEVPLLLLRCALLVGLGLLMAGPSIPLAALGAGGGGWVLASPEFLAAPGAAPRFDELMAQGHELRVLAPGFPATVLADTTGAARAENAWSLLREAEALEARGPILAVFTLDRLTSVRGRRPELHSRPDWYALPTAGENRWIESARFVEAGRARVVVGSSNAHRTRFTGATVSLPPEGGPVVAPEIPALEARIDGDGTMLRLHDADAEPEDDARIVVPTGPGIPVTISASAGRANDAALVRAAVEAAAGFAGIPVRFEAEAGGPGIAFWLSEAPVPAELEAQVARGLTLVRDAASDRYEAAPSWIVAEGAAESDAPRIARRVPASPRGLALWRDGFGQPLLEVEREGAGIRYLFHSRFHPQWSELAQHPAFPGWILQLLAGPGPASPGLDMRAAGVSQLSPARLETASGARRDRARSLALPLWALVVLLFAAERWVSARRAM